MNVQLAQEKLRSREWDADLDALRREIPQLQAVGLDGGEHLVGGHHVGMLN